MKRKLNWDKLIIFLSLLVTPFLHIWVTSLREYKAFGGECLLPLVVVAIVTFKNEVKEMRDLFNDF